MEPSDETWAYGNHPYPNTCDKCPSKGEFSIVGDCIPIKDVDFRYTGEYQWRNVGWPDRCKPCNAKAQARKRANHTIHRLEELRCMVQDAFAGLKGAEDRWCFLKFVTLTWKNESVPESEPDMKKARKWLLRKRTKICNRLDILGGTDVLECVTTEKDGLYYHHVHSHGVWLMPFHPIKEIGQVMKTYVGRDETRAIQPKNITLKNGQEITISAFAQARNYIMKYLTKQPNTRRSSWGFARKSLTAEDFYGEVCRIHDKWSAV